MAWMYVMYVALGFLSLNWIMNFPHSSLYRSCIIIEKTAFSWEKIKN